MTACLNLLETVAATTDSMTLAGHSIWAWGGFILFVLLMLALDLFVLHKDAHEVTMKEAAIWSCVWVSIALLFNAGVWIFIGPNEGLDFFAGYLTEKALSVDNIFVIVLIFQAYGIPAMYQHRVLFWGIIGALILRGIMIGLGAALVSEFEWVLYLFGAFLLWTGIKMAMHKEAEDGPPRERWLVKQAMRFLPVTDGLRGQQFFVREPDKRFGPDRGPPRLHATPLFAVLILVEFTDLIFAVDSIPAIFGITKDPFIVFTSNIFAILGLRALFFLLAGMVHKFHFLKLGLAVVLSFIGVKLLALFFKIHVSTAISLPIIGGVLILSVWASLKWPKQAAKLADHHPDLPKPETDVVSGGPIGSKDSPNPNSDERM